MTFNWGGRYYKRQARTFSLDNLPAPPRSLWMPSDECICVKEAIEKGVLDRTSEIIAVERDRAIYSRMLATLGSLGFLRPPRTFNCELSTVRLPFDLDLVNIDLCGSLTADVVVWAEETLSRHIVEGCTIILTTRFGWRNNPFLIHAERRFLNEYRRIAEEVTLEIGSRHEKEVVPLLVFMSALHGYVAHTTALRYYDFTDNDRVHHQPMMLYRMENLRRRTEPTKLPTLHELTKGFRMTREAALKAWDTRRKKLAEAKKREIAAKTPRWNAEAKKRREAEMGRSLPDDETARFLEYRRRALKAWDTRRARARAEQNS
jgi:hypothetical protein